MHTSDRFDLCNWLIQSNRIVWTGLKSVKEVGWKARTHFCHIFFHQINNRTTWFRFIHKVCRKWFDPFYKMKRRKLRPMILEAAKRGVKICVLQQISIWRERKSNFVHGNLCASVKLAFVWNFNLSNWKINKATTTKRIETKSHSRDSFDSVSTNYRVILLPFHHIFGSSVLLSFAWVRKSI